MDTLQILFYVIVAALSVIGFYGVIHALLEGLMLPAPIATAVVLAGDTSPEELDILLCEARRAPVGRRRVILLVDTALLEGTVGERGTLYPAYEEMVAKYGVELFIGVTREEELSERTSVRTDERM